MTGTASDAELVKRARLGELDAYEELVRRYQGLIVRVAFLITGNVGDAEDVAQEALIKAYSSLGRVQPESFRPWLLRIVANQARNLRKAARRHTDALARASSEGLAASPAPTPEMAVLADEQRTVLLRALDALREEDRLAISYRYLFDLSENDMVEALGWPRGTVKSRLARALGRFRQQVGQLALLPPAAFALPHVARELASWSEVQLEQGLTGLASQFSELPVPDLSAAVMPRLQAASPTHGGVGQWLRAPTHWLLVSGAAAVTLTVAVTSGQLSPRQEQPTPTLAPAAPVGAAPNPPPAPASRTIVVYGGDLSDAARDGVGRLFGVGPTIAVETIRRDEVLSTLTAAGLPAPPEAETLSSVRMDCGTADGSLAVRTEHIALLPPLTYVTALLAAGSTDASVIVAGPAGTPVTGETALVGMLRAAGRCTGDEPKASSRVSLAYLVLDTTGRLAQASSDWRLASTIIARAVQAVVTGQARDEAAIGAALDLAAGETGLTLDRGLRAEVASRLTSLIGQEYGRFAQGFRIDQPSPNQARLVP
ncbi:MAG: DUF1002 domain-containing protein [Chloroflexota bacterium]|nr:DUF1002 domain-containing protein [Chloroflexota bacterium]